MTPAELPFSPAAERNQGPILDELRRWWPARARVLEIASGTGQHAAHMAAACPGWQWQPTEAQDPALQVIAARCAGLPNVAAPLRLDVLAEPWPADLHAAGVDAVICANLLHIAPWAVCGALMRGAAQRLAPQGWLVIYGPFVEAGVPTAPSNLAFDVDLRRRDPSWGLRRLQDVVDTAAGVGLRLTERVAMPANNLLLAFRPITPADRAAA